ncbi:uncharacterized protein LOC130447815 isoform X4 [Diorhabda sublineata]|uniref:uncharacterized protein LOC130447815 isoform X4 n=1 Tax=Diorhabda sublineata TaxID=1163346 RepID=UPI0024E1420E|nr:uncharacterized protein LOC130447815 isoform X4 [Diorhabda sublineata]
MSKTKAIHLAKTTIQKMPLIVYSNRHKNEHVSEEEEIVTIVPTTAATIAPADVTYGDQTADASGWDCSKNGVKQKQMIFPKYGTITGQILTAH